LSVYSRLLAKILIMSLQYILLLRVIFSQIYYFSASYTHLWKEWSSGKGMKCLKLFQFRDGTLPDPTRVYFWTAVKKGPTRLWLRYFLTWPDEIFSIWREKSWNFGEKFSRFRGSWLGLTQVKKFWHRTHHYFNPMLWSSVIWRQYIIKTFTLVSTKIFNWDALCFF